MPIQIICKHHKLFKKKFSLLAAMATSQNQQFGKIYMVCKGLLLEPFCNFFCENKCSNTEINANFLFSHYKSIRNFELPIAIVTKHTGNNRKKHYLYKDSVSNIVNRDSASSPIIPSEKIF